MGWQDDPIIENHPAAQPRWMSDPIVEPAAERSLGQRLYDNVIGDPTDGVTSTGEALGTWLNRAGEAMTAGVVGDEASAAVSAPVKRALAATGLPVGNADATYSSELQRFRQNEDQMSGLGRISADVAGSLVPAALGVGAVSSAPTVLSAMGRGAAIGAGLGGVQGFMEGEGSANGRLASAAVGGVVGGVAGGAIPAIGAGASAAYRGLRDAAASNRVAAAVSKDLGIGRPAARALSQVVDFDSAEGLRAGLERAGPGAMLADAGPSTAQALDSAMRSPGQAARIALERIDARASQAAQGIERVLNETLGAPDLGQEGLKAAVRSSTAPARQAAYDAAYASPIDYAAPAGQRIESLLRRVPAAAFRRADDLMRLEGVDSQQILASVAEDGSVALSRLPDVRQLDYITRAMNDVAEEASAKGKLGGTTDLGRAMGNLSRTIRSTVRDAVPAYGKALDTAADAISEVKGIDLGSAMFSPSMTREKVTEALRGASAAERGAVKRGVRAAIDERLANVRAVISDHEIEPRQAMEAYRSMTSPAAQEKMRLVLGEDWPKLQKAIREAGVALSLRARTGQNSLTAARQFMDQALNNAVEPGALRKGEPMKAAKEAVATMAGASKTAVDRLRASAKADVADVLTRPGYGTNALASIEAARSQNALAPSAGWGINAGVNVLGLGLAPQQAASGVNALLGW